MLQHRIFIMLLLITPNASAEWSVMKHMDVDSSQQTLVAQTRNPEGYSLEIYRDGNNAIRARFSMGTTLDRLDGKNCPTHQVDKRSSDNRSINDAACIAHRRWAEYVLGYISGNEVTSSFLHNMMNGTTISYRFMLDPSGYAETTFSLAGSKRALLEALGSDLVVHTESGFSN